MAAITQALQGLASSQSQFDSAASRIAQWPQAPPPSGTTPSDTVSLSAEAVAMLQAQNSFEVNIKTLEVAEQMEQTLLKGTS